MRKPNWMQHGFHWKQSTLYVGAPLFMLNAFVFVAMASYAPFLGAYYSDQLGMSPAQIGQLFGVGPLVAMLFQPIWAHISDRTGKRRNVLMCVCLLCAMAMLLFYTANSFPTYLLAAICLSAFSASIVPLSDSILIMRAQEKNLAFSHIRAAGTIGYALVVYFFGFLYKDHANYIFAASSAMYALLAFIIFRLPDDAPRSSQAQGSADTISEKPFSFRAEFVFLALFAFVIHTGFNFSNSFLGVYTVSLGYDRSVLGFMNSMAAFCELPALLGIHRLLRRFGAIPLIVFAGLLLSARIFMVATGQIGLIFFGQMIQSSGYIILYCCCAMYIGAHVPKAHQSKAQTAYAIVHSGLANLAGYMLGGRIADTVGLQIAYRDYGWFSLLGTVGLGFAYYLFAKRQRRIGRDIQL